MKQEKKEWTPTITNLHKEVVAGVEQWVEFDIEGYVIPAGHSYYDKIVGMNRRELRKGA